MFRLTEDEYASLKEASVRARRSISDFTRSELLAVLGATDVGDANSWDLQMDRQLSTLEDTVRDLKKLLQGGATDRRPANDAMLNAAPETEEGHTR